ncbi:MAG: PEGA domain-containing protein [Polyangiaceae bacterium]|nr:PEGA domain-containing protein [Polyangiaceae bacterium]
MRTPKWVGPLLLAATVCASAPPARAQEDQAAARSLFDEGRQLMAAGKHAEACPKFEAAQKLFNSTGILLNLADCYEKTGRLASAWTRFGEAASVAARAGRNEDAEEARARQAALAPKLSRLKLEVKAPKRGMKITRDGVPLAEAAWSSAIPVDPGEHDLQVEAPGYEAWRGKVDVATPGDTTTFEIPELKAAPEGAEGGERGGTEGAGGAVEPDSAGGSQGTIGLVLGGVGVVGMGVGGFLGLGAKSTYDEAEAAAGDDRQTKSQDAVSQANVATIVFGVGAALAATGIVLWVTAPSGTPDPSADSGPETSGRPRTRPVARRSPRGVRVGVAPAWGGLGVIGQFD